MSSALQIVPTWVHDSDGETVAVSHAARVTLAEMIEQDAAYLYTPLGDAHYYQVWLNHEVDPSTGYRGVRIPLADWARAYEAERGEKQQQQQTA